MTRRQAREEAFILIFEKVFNQDSVEEILELAAETRDLTPDDYIKTVFSGVYEKLDLLDEIIAENSIGWNIKRISKTALCVLRLAIFEIMFMDAIPVAVSINEAVELCKKYATAEDASFVNGILSTVAKSL
ncbi:MAG: transcription antitermination factor NusB [Clostridia bacterium]|nr:transcription antitermination factor NusB [Oscillospiraceae bacterium]MBO5357819.1 transcription antitermination factor NusB [Clostridia bacterium]